MMAGDQQRNRGQVLPLFALFLVVLLAFAALAIDVSGAYSARRFYRSVADAAALAGAQDLQQTGSRAVGSADRIRARQHAMNSVTSELGIAGSLPGTCSTSTDADIIDSNAVTDCVLPGTSFHVSIKAGVYTGQPVAIACVECDPARSVQVGLRNANYQLTFSRLLGQSKWSVGISSVAGLQWSKSYAVVTLRPRATLGSTYDVKDIRVEGGTHVTVTTGDVATNANMDYADFDSWLHVDDGFGMSYADPGPPIAPTWSGLPIGTHITTYVADPNYTYPAMSGVRGFAACASGLASDCAPTYRDAGTSACRAPYPTPDPLRSCTTPAVDPAGCGAEVTYLQTSVYTFMATQPLANIYCYKPGIYAPLTAASTTQFAVATGDVAILMPGAYYFMSPNGGLTVGGRIVGGYRPGSEGVALMFDECGSGSPHCTFSGNNAVTISLNAGTKFPPGSSGVSATAAHDWNDRAVQTSGAGSPTPAILMTLLVQKDGNCTVTTYPQSEPNSCNDSNNKTLFMAGGGSLAVEGVQYAPTDNVVIAGGSAGVGQVGQVWAWTLDYKGGTQVNQQGAGSTGPGVLRLDAACTAPGTPCNP
jgi:hypothetical protein